MPEFILDHGTPEASKRYAALDDFTQGYIEAAFFTETSTTDDSEDNLENASVAELAPQAWERITRDCEAFKTKAADLLALAYERDGYDEQAAGRDFWYTRNGHGVGFWDRDALTADDLGKKLSALCRYSEVYVCRGDDGLIYFE